MRSSARAAWWCRVRGARDPPHAAAGPMAPITAVNEVWTTDFKGEFRTGDGRYCYPLTLRDGFSRFVLRCDGFLSRSTDATRDRFTRAFREYGLPQRIRSDNGGPFASPGLGRLSQLSVWWMRLSIIPERIAPGHPEQNGSHEQFHSVLKAETARPPAPNCTAQQQRFRRFVREYNDERPHEALDNQPPARRYTPSLRELPARLPPIDYPGHMEVRLVSSNGCVSWRNAPLFIRDPARWRTRRLRRSRRWGVDGALRHGRARSIRRTSSHVPADPDRSERWALRQLRWLRA